MKKFMYLFLFTLIGCSTASKYPNWEKVFILTVNEPTPSEEICTYKVQEVCHPLAMTGCYIWYKKRATRFEANVVHIEKEQSGAMDGIASYYSCKDQTNLGEYIPILK